MPRSLTSRKPRAAEIRRLHQVLTEALTPRQRRRAEAIVLHAAGREASAIATALGVHVNTIYADLRAFDQQGVASVRYAKRRMTASPIEITFVTAPTTCGRVVHFHGFVAHHRGVIPQTSEHRSQPEPAGLGLRSPRGRKT